MGYNRSVKKARNMLLVGLTVSVLFLGVIPSAYADTDGVELPTQRILPGTLLYNVKRVWEKTREKLVFSDEGKASYHHDLLKKRLYELEYATESSMAEVADASLRASYEAGRVVELLEQIGDEDKSKDFREALLLYGKILPPWRDRFPANSAYWLWVQQTIDSFNILANRLQ